MQTALSTLVDRKMLVCIFDRLPGQTLARTHGPVEEIADEAALRGMMRHVGHLEPVVPQPLEVKVGNCTPRRGPRHATRLRASIRVLAAVQQHPTVLL
jgi:hypothetical protein